jgi:hypothetical protein
MSILRNHPRPEAEAVHDKTPALADGGDQDSRDRGADQAGGVDHGRIQRDGVPQVLGVPLDHVHDEGLADRHVERVNGAQQDAEDNDRPDADRVGEDQDGEGQSLNQGKRLGQEEHLVPVPAVGEDAGERGDHEHRQLPRETDDPEHQGGVGQSVNQPSQGDHLEPGPDEREALPADEQPEVPVLQGAEHELEPAVNGSQVPSVKHCANLQSIGRRDGPAARGD